MAEVQLSLLGLEELNRFAVDLRGRSVKARASVGRTVSNYGTSLVSNVVARASGRPGPNAPTGDYRRTWAPRRIDHDGVIAVEVGTDAPQARRLEYGFPGIDSLGRHYKQPAFPHAGPAFDAVKPRFEAALLKILEDDA